MFEGILIILLFIGVALISRSATTLVHELGHAIPSLFFTKEEVIVCVGSYGDVSNSLEIKLGRLTIYLKFNFLAWNLGLCAHQGANGFWKTLLIIVGVPVASLFLALTLLFLIITNDLSDTVIVVFTFFILSSIWDFMVNIYPISSPAYLFDGSEVYNDGYRFLNLIRLRNYPDAYYQAKEFAQSHDYNNAISGFKALLADGFNTREINDQIISNLMKRGDFEEALSHFGSYKLPKKLKSRDYFTLGAIYFELNRYEEGIKCLNKAIHGDFQNVQYLSKRGRCFFEIGAFENAIRDFNASIYYNPDYYLAFLWRGQAKLKMGELESAFSDLQKVLEFDTELAELYLYLGFYYERKGEFSNAVENFEKAKTLDSDYHGLDFLIEENKSLVER